MFEILFAETFASYTSKTYDPIMFTFVKSSIFARYLADYLTDDEYTIYYLQLRRGEIWLLTLYGKNVTENIPGHILKKLKEAFENERS